MPKEPPMSKQFASHAELTEKKVTFDRLSPHAWAYTAEGDPNSGIVVGDDAVMVIDTQATPVMAQDVIRRIREVTDKPIRYVLLSHYHAVRVLGASAYGASHVIASQDTRDLIVERGAQDMKSEIERFPRLFRAVESVPGLTWPNLVFKGEMTLWLGALEVRIMQLGRGHTKGDTVVWLPQDRVLFSGDLVEYDTTPYAGDAYYEDWPVTRGAQAGRDLRSVYRETYDALKPKYGQWVIFDHCMPFDVTRAYDLATKYPDPRIWTAQRDQEMWQALEGEAAPASTP